MRHLITTDIHGRYDEFTAALEAARYDETADRLVLLGDLIDRGRQSREVLDYLADLMERQRDIELIRGNHEDILRAFLEGKPAALRSWIDTCQGLTLLRSYRYDPSRLSFAGDRVWADGKEIVSRDDARAFLLEVMPEPHLAVIEAMRRYRVVIPHGLWGESLLLPRGSHAPHKDPGDAAMALCLGRPRVAERAERRLPAGHGLRSLSPAAPAARQIQEDLPGPRIRGGGAGAGGSGDRDIRRRLPGSHP